MRPLTRFLHERFPFLRGVIGVLRVQKYYLSLRFRPTSTVFGKIYREKGWGGEESVSGGGSSLLQTRAIRAALPSLLRELQCEVLVDVPCGDFNWMKEVCFDGSYIGGDIVDDLVQENQRRYGNSNRRFVRADVIEGPLPRGDLVLCRDCLVHLSHAKVRRALQTIKRSGAQYLLATTFRRVTRNVDIPTGAWRPLNLTLPPFNLPAPLRSIEEDALAPGYEDKSLGLWRVADLAGH